MKKILSLLCIGLLFSLQISSYKKSQNLLTVYELFPTVSAQETSKSTPNSDPTNNGDTTNNSPDLNQKLQQLLPSQELLFDKSKRLDKDNDGVIDANEQVRFIDGDLEQGFAPKVLKLLISFSGLGFFVIFTFAGIKIILAKGDEEEVTKAKQLLLHSVIGVILITGSLGVVLGILKFFSTL